ncbi:MAG TPA: SDR family NAD(P)-dependent oxidoreductase, partial [Candidatus Binatia bacterium]
GGAEAKLRENGVYLITGGLGNIGLVLAEYLAKTVNAKLVLVGRSSLPPKEEWASYLQRDGDHDAAAMKIRRIQAMEQAGAEILTVAADVADEKQMAAAIARADQRFGGIHGVIHAAGTIAGVLIPETSPERCVNQFRSKVDGLLILDKLLRGRRLDFRLLTSSISCVLGGLGYSAYAAGNLFMDAFASNAARTNTPWITVNYDSWNFSGPTAPTPARALIELALTPEEGVEVFRRALALDGAAHVVVSTGDLQARIDQWVKLEALRGNGAVAEEKPQEPASLHTRPDLSSSYAAPSTPTEEALVEIWKHLFGLEQVGIHDDFFELGGHSLLAMQVVSRIRSGLEVNLPLNYLFEKPTVSGLAERIETIRWASRGVASGGPASGRTEIEL